LCTLIRDLKRVSDQFSLDQQDDHVCPGEESALNGCQKSTCVRYTAVCISLEWVKNKKNNHPSISSHIMDILILIVSLIGQTDVNLTVKQLKETWSQATLHAFLVFFFYFVRN